MFADVRGSTTLAEQMSAEEFSQLMARFYGAAAEVVDRRNGIVDKFVGDQAMALFIPGFAGADHASDAIEAAHELLVATGHGNGGTVNPPRRRRPHGRRIRGLRR
jgi:adenylate cyclase